MKCPKCDNKKLSYDQNKLTRTIREKMKKNGEHFEFECPKCHYVSKYISKTLISINNIEDGRNFELTIQNILSNHNIQKDIIVEIIESFLNGKPHYPLSKFYDLTKKEQFIIIKEYIILCSDTTIYDTERFKRISQNHERYRASGIEGIMKKFKKKVSCIKQKDQHPLDQKTKYKKMKYTLDDAYLSFKPIQDLFIILNRYPDMSLSLQIIDDIIKKITIYIDIANKETVSRKQTKIKPIRKNITHIYADLKKENPNWNKPKIIREISRKLQVDNRKVSYYLPKWVNNL